MPVDSQGNQLPDRPHAIIFPTGWAPPQGTPFPGLSRGDKLCTYFENILGGTRQKNPAYIRQLAGGPRHMASLDPHDSLLYPTGHELEKLPRYDRYPQPDGTEYCYLKDEADAAKLGPEAVAMASRDMERMREEAKATDDKVKRFMELKKIPAGEITPAETEERSDLFAELCALSELFATLHDGETY